MMRLLFGVQVFTAICIALAVLFAALAAGAWIGVYASRVTGRSDRESLYQGIGGIFGVLVLLAALVAMMIPEAQLPR